MANENGREWGFYRGNACVARLFADGRCESTDGLGNATGQAIQPPAALPAGAAVGAWRDDNGVVTSKINNAKPYTLSGVEITREHAHSLLSSDGLVDDTDRWHLTCVGGADLLAKFREDVANLGELRNKLHIQWYSAEAWAVKQYNLPAGVSLRKPSIKREGVEVGVVAPTEYNAKQLDVLLYPVSGKKPEPVPQPKPDPYDPLEPSPLSKPVNKPQSEPVKIDPQPVVKGITMDLLTQALIGIGSALGGGLLTVVAQAIRNRTGRTSTPVLDAIIAALKAQHATPVPVQPAQPADVDADKLAELLKLLQKK